jgi:hypothetical protein
MKPAYDQLGDEYADSSSVLIGDADCTEGAKDLCSKHGVSGYPTIKYFMQGEEAKDYSGGRDFDSLNTFVKDTLQKLCTVEAPADCSEKENGFIAKNKGKSVDDVAKSLARLEGMKGKSMAPELKKWLMQRINILKQL